MLCLDGSGQVVFFFFFLHLFIYFWLCWVFVSVRGLSLAVASRGHSSSRCVGLSLTITASPVAEHRIQTRRLGNHGSRAQPLRGMWDLPRPGLEPVSPALAGRFSTAAPPGKPRLSLNSSEHGGWENLARRALWSKCLSCISVPINGTTVKLLPLP